MSINPVTSFVAVALVFGTLIVLISPPLRGPDETAHFLRAYGIAQGDIVSSLRDAEGRKGVLVPPRLYEGFDFFESVRIKEKGGAEEVVVATVDLALARRPGSG